MRGLAPLTLRPAADVRSRVGKKKRLPWNHPRKPLGHSRLARFVVRFGASSKTVRSAPLGRLGGTC
eukprot:9125568-Alexandrium_andersonii.AAC.1